MNLIVPETEVNTYYKFHSSWSIESYCRNRLVDFLYLDRLSNRWSAKFENK